MDNKKIAFTIFVDASKSRIKKQKDKNSLLTKESEDFIIDYNCKKMTLRQLISNLQNDLESQDHTDVHLDMTMEEYIKNLIID